MFFFPVTIKMTEKNSDAIESFTHDLRVAIQKGDRFREGCAYSNLGNAYWRLGNFKKAMEYHQNHLSLSKTLGDKAGEGTAYGNLGIISQCIGDFKQAIDYHSRRLSIAKDIGDKAYEGLVLCHLGIAYFSVGNFREAIERHKQQLKIAKDVGDRTLEGYAYSNLGKVNLALSNFKQAIEFHNQHLSISKQLGDKTGEGNAYGNLGNAFQCLGDFKHAIAYYNLLLISSQELGDRAREGSTYGNLGNSYVSLGDLKQAMEYHRKHLNIAKEVGDRDGEGSAYGNLGNACCLLGDFKQAIEYIKLRLSFAKETGNKSAEGRSYGSLGNAYESLGDFKQAIEYHKKHLNFSKDIGDRACEGMAYGSLGNAYYSLGDFKLAQEYHKQHLEISKEVGDRSGEGKAYVNLANDYFRLGDFTPGLECHKLCLSIIKTEGDRYGEGRAYCNLGDAHLNQGNFKQAKDYFYLSLIIAKEVGDRVGNGQACYGLGIGCEFLGSLHEALDYYQSSVRQYNNIRALLLSEDAWKISLRNNFQHAYAALWRILVKLQKTNEALLAAEQGRAQALMELIKLRYGFDLLPFVEPKSTIGEILSSISTQTVFIALDRNTVNFWVLCEGKDVKFIQKEIEVKNEHVATILQHLIKDAFNENGIGARVKCEDRSMEELRGALTFTNEPDLKTEESIRNEKNSLRLLYDAVISPIAQLLHGDKLIIVPDGPLCLAPYAAFIDHDSKYLSETTRIRRIPSLTSLKLIADCPDGYHSKSGALLVGNPCMEEVTNKLGEPMFQPLPFSREEVEMIGKILKTAPLTGGKATKEEVLRRITSVALVHIASHGEMESGEIALAPNTTRTSKIPEEKDFILTMSDVQAVQLRAKLVVLSCCHSGRGKVTAEGVVGIARAFLGAGARSVLVTLWAIDDEATMEFIKSFYQHLAVGKSASVALHQAMTCLRESDKFGDVKSWAPFVLIGDDVTIEFGKHEEDVCKYNYI